MSSGKGSAVRELRGLIADRLIWWAWRLDRDRFLAVDEKSRPVAEMEIPHGT